MQQQSTLVGHLSDGLNGTCLVLWCCSVRQGSVDLTSVHYMAQRCPSARTATIFLSSGWTWPWPASPGTRLDYMLLSWKPFTRRTPGSGCMLLKLMVVVVLVVLVVLVLVLVLLLVI